MLKKLSIFLLLVGLKHVICCAVPRNFALKCEPAFEAPVHGSVSCSNANNYGSMCTFACDEGYKMVGDNFPKCILFPAFRISWNQKAPKCEPELAVKKYQLQKTIVKGNFIECQKMCLQQGGTLAQHSLSSAPGYDYTEDMWMIAGGLPMWIGVNNDNSQNEWRYTSIGGGKKPFPITTKDPTSPSLVGKWARGQPGKKDQLCATIYKYDNDLFFSTFTCDPAEPKQLYGICEHP